MIQNDNLYKKTALGSWLLCIARECYKGVMFEAHEGEYGSHSRGRNLSQLIMRKFIIGKPC